MLTLGDPGHCNPRHWHHRLPLRGLRPLGNDPFAERFTLVRHDEPALCRDGQRAMRMTVPESVASARASEALPPVADDGRVKCRAFSLVPKSPPSARLPAMPPGVGGAPATYRCPLRGQPSDNGAHDRFRSTLHEEAAAPLLVTSGHGVDAAHVLLTDAASPTFRRRTQNRQNESPCAGHTRDGKLARLALGCDPRARGDIHAGSERDGSARGS
jgi:hypothetical protein